MQLHIWWSRFEMPTPPYLAAAKDLEPNKEQWAAYQSEGHFVTLAGPGSGKTKVLTTKLARIIHEDIETPRGLACVTYSNECARELKRRLKNIGVSGTGRVFVGTVHSFCFQHIVRPYARLAGLDIAWPIRVATQIQQDEQFSKAVSNALGPDQNPYDWRFRSMTYRRIYLDRKSASWKEADRGCANVTEEYERLLRKQGLIDYDDMMLLGLQLVKGHEWVRTSLHAKFPAFIVDEYQDLGVPLHQLVMALCFTQGEKNCRLFAVGDPDQSIYGFAGAQPNLLRELSQRSDVGTKTLRLNYRSRQNIIDASEFALGEDRGYQSSTNETGVIEFHGFPEGLRQQASFIASELVPSLLNNGVVENRGDIAVLYCTKYEGDVIADKLTEEDTEFLRIDNNAAYPKTTLTRWLEDCAQWCMSDGGSEAPLLRSIIVDYRKLNQKLRLGREQTEAGQKLVRCLMRHNHANVRLSEWLNALATDCLMEHLKEDGSQNQEVENLEALINQASDDGKLSNWTVERFGGQGGTPEHLNLMTLHSSKGLEFEVVILFAMNDGIIPSYRQTKPQQKLEPRRLFYVGLTRAKTEVHITYSAKRETKYNTRVSGPSEFVAELKERLESE